ncbi:acyl-[acyl-carrier-protein] thioesterase [Bdellovibrio sp. HCB-162]|uniref:acyl-[acyl-carrier-protein] thioesterase n=1 Tax=Bdellovibrio sp. HCB-162 TaxID=3394234 RepID=UPI0039BD3E9C
MSKSEYALWTEKYHITSLLVNPLGRLGLYGTLNLIQETAWMHAERLGFGMQDMEREGLYWVLTRQTLHMKEWPRFGQNIKVQTWLRPPEGAFVTREFAILNENDKEIGLCATSWLALDRQTKKILPAQNLRDWDHLTYERSSGLTPEKIPVAGEYEKLAKYRVRNSDLDINQHVNNTKYAQWILDAIPYEYHKSLLLKSYSVNFLAETHLGDKVQIDRSLQSPDVHNNSQGTTNYKGARVGDDKVLFTATLEWEKRS